MGSAPVFLNKETTDQYTVNSRAVSLMSVLGGDSTSDYKASNL